MRLERGIATTALAVIVVIIVVVAGGAAYFALSGSGSSSPSTTATSSHSASSSTGTSTSASSTLASSQSSQSSSASSTVSSATSASSSSSTASYSTFSCSTTYTTGTGPATDYTPQYINLISKFSEITFKVEGTYNGTQNQNSTISYKTATVSAGIYDVNVTFASTSSTESGVARVDSNNNSVISMTFSGYTFRGTQAKSFFDAIFALFGLEYTYSGYLGILTSSAYFHSTGSAPMTFGTTTFPVTTWVANSLPLSINECGYTTSLTAYTLQAGTPPGTSLTFLTYLHIAASSPVSEDFTFQLVSMTQA